MGVYKHGLHCWISWNQDWLLDVFVVVDKFSKISHFIPYKRTHYASCIAHIFFRKVVRTHCLPINIVLDRDVKFMGFFWKKIWIRFGTF